MENKQWVSDAQKSEFSLVYMYLVAGIALAVAVFLFIPRISVG